MAVEMVMSLGEYLRRRCGGHKANTALSRREAEIIGIPYPLTHGWPQRYKDLMLTQAQQDQLQEALRVFRVTKRNRRAAKKAPETLVAKKEVAQKFFSNSFAFVGTDAFLESFEWRRLRMKALKQYGAKCMCCGATPASGAVMNVDHIKPRKIFPELALSLENLQILCHDCNHGKGNWDMTDWRSATAGQ